MQYYETDKMGITHHSNYIRWMEEARIDFLEQIGWNYEKLEEMGIVSPVIGVEGKYRKSTTFSDTVSILVFIDEIKGLKMRIGYVMKKEDGSVAFDGYSEHCFMDREGKPVRLKKDYPDFYEALIKSGAKEE